MEFEISTGDRLSSGTVGAWVRCELNRRVLPAAGFIGAVLAQARQRQNSHVSLVGKGGAAMREAMSLGAGLGHQRALFHNCAAPFLQLPAVRLLS